MIDMPDGYGRTAMKVTMTTMMVGISTNGDLPRQWRWLCWLEGPSDDFVAVDDGDDDDDDGGNDDRDDFCDSDEGSNDRTGIVKIWWWQWLTVMTNIVVVLVMMVVMTLVMAMTMVMT